MRRPVVVGLASVLLLFGVACDNDNGGNGGNASPTGTGQDDEGGAPSGDPIRIGVILSETGPFSALGADEIEGARVAADYLNDNGGVLDRPIELIFRDDESSPERSVAAANELITNENVVAILGPAVAPVVLPAVPVASDAEIPMLSTSGGFLAAVEEEHLPYTFAIGPDFNKGVPPFFELWEEQGHSDVALVGANAPLYENTKGFVEANIADYGLELSGEATFPADAQDVKPQLTQLGSPDAVLVPATGPIVATILRDFRDLGMEADFATHAGQTTDEFVQLVGADTMEGVYAFGWRAAVAEQIPEGPTRDAVDTYIEAMSAAVDDFDPAGTAILGWEGVMALAAAIEDAGSAEPSDIRDALETQTYQGALGEWNKTPEDHEGIERPYVIIQFDGSEWQYISG